MQGLARQANFGTWNAARQCIERVVDVISGWRDHATDVGVGVRTRALVAKELERTHRENRALLAGAAGSGGRG